MGGRSRKQETGGAITQIVGASLRGHPFSDRLVFSNGVIILAVFSGLLVAAFKGDTSRLIPLYAAGVFLSFTLSQSGMVRNWLKGGQLLRRRRASERAKENNRDSKISRENYPARITDEGDVNCSAPGICDRALVAPVTAQPKFTSLKWGVAF